MTSYESNRTSKLQATSPRQLNKWMITSGANLVWNLGVADPVTEISYFIWKMYDFQENNFVFFSHQLEKLSFFLKYLPFLPFAPTFWTNCSLFRENRPLSNILSVKIDYSNIPRPIHDPICEPSAQNLGVAIPQTPPGLTPMMITHPFKDLTHPTLVSYCHVSCDRI